MFFRLKKIWVSFAGHYRPDLRALALMRIAAALVVIADLLIRGSDLEAHYTDQGLWPRELIKNFGWQPGFWSIHQLFGSTTGIFLLFALHFVAALFLLLGYKTRLATIITWLMTISLHNRNLFVLQSGDDLLRLLLLWGCFLPWGNRYALDAKRYAAPRNNITLAYLGYLLFLASVYFFSAIQKSGSDWHEDGSAVYYALSLEQIRLPLLGDWLYGSPKLMKFLTWFVYYLELLVPALILWPSRRGAPRFIAFLLLLMLQAGFGSTLYVGLFFVISIIASIGMLPGFVMNRFEKILQLSKTEANRMKRYRPLPVAINNLLCALLIFFCLSINLGSVKWFSYELNPEYTAPLNVIRLNQYWGMFSPYVMKKDGWFVYYGIDSIGRQWDLGKNQDYVDFSKPAHIVSLYKSDRWRKLAENMQDDRFTFLRPLYCKYILRTWNKDHPEKKIVTLNLNYMEKHSLPDYKTTPVEKKLFCVCIND